jgi:hypothetical protein
MAGIVEVERDGMIHRARYWVDGAVVIVNYGAREKRRALCEHEDSYGIAQRLLQEIIAELHE